ncbi:uncharacterized protein CDV56_106503 [Aspergillus thermomutatus]|uniref:Uncharacterized protein n=1 Tax=Aspergillus thermomutatus TaxID=41047 RepID=A0A397H579_ASPTH|nr:uncharacterized protein CDV56_106503 [Aspergillus thermomutatus]RHZ55560.1 hypothetical protein CDV56_106503 [Aspergillus thermomutatus]
MNGNNQSGSTYACWLPNEIWMRIAYFLPRMPDQPRWQPWIKYRGLNRIFKKEIEDYYFMHWIEDSEIWVQCRERDPPDFPESRLDVREFYSFSSLLDSEKRIAVFKGQHLNRTDPRSRLELIRIEKKLKEFNEKGYHPYIAFLIEDGETNLLPMDLCFQPCVTMSYFTFDWRTYLSTLLDELRLVDEYEERTGYKSQARLAAKLEWKVKTERMTPLEARLELARAAGTELVGRDGRLLEIRRRRRYRLGVRTGQLRPLPPSLVPRNVLEHRFVQLDEEHVSDLLLSMAWNDDGAVYEEW